MTAPFAPAPPLPLIVIPWGMTAVAIMVPFAGRDDWIGWTAFFHSCDHVWEFGGLSVFVTEAPQVSARRPSELRTALIRATAQPLAD